jgi:hypothetical protein
VSDRLALANAFEDAGISRDKAQHVASVIVDVIHAGVATKADLTAVRSEIKDAVQQLTMRGLFGAVSLFFALLGALHYWPPQALGH